MFPLALRASKAVSLLLILISSVTLAFSQGRSAVLESRENSFSPGRFTGVETVEAPDPAAVVSRFVAAESEVREALNQHTFKRDVVLQTIGPNGEVTGEYIRNSQFIFDDKGRRIERVLYHPSSTIREMRITKEDIQDLASSQLLGIDVVEANKYQLTYVGRTTIDSQEVIAIDVRPAVQPDPNHMSERYFVGRVWIDPVSFQVLKVKGTVEPQGKQRFPMFETWRQPVNGGTAFPVRTEADDVLHFLGRDVHYRIKVRYYDYKVFGSKVTIKEVDQPVPSETESSPGGIDILKKEPPVMRMPAPGRASAPVGSSSISMASCDENRNSPPVGPYHWPADAEVKVYFVRGMFTSEERASALEAMKAWSNASEELTSGVTFADAGESAGRMNCRSCLTIERRDVYQQDKHHYAFFYPMSEEDGRLLVSAWIDLDFGITNSKALQGFVVHELGHGLGLWDCTTCKKKLTIMNGFPGLNKDNGIITPSRCDLATVHEVYQRERQLASGRSGANRSRAGAADYSQR
jgi:hypothetical protein